MMNDSPERAHEERRVYTKEITLILQTRRARSRIFHAGRATLVTLLSFVLGWVFMSSLIQGALFLRPWTGILLVTGLFTGFVGLQMYLRLMPRGLVNGQDIDLEMVDQVTAPPFTKLSLSGLMVDTSHNLSCMNFDGSDLSTTNLSRCLLHRAQFRGARLRGTLLCNTECTYANFADADLDGTDFTGANVSHADFTRAKLGRQNPHMWSTVKGLATAKGLPPGILSDAEAAKRIPPPRPQFVQ